MTLLKRLRHTFLRRQKGYSKKRPLLAEFLEARSMLSASSINLDSVDNTYCSTLPVIDDNFQFAAQSTASTLQLAPLAETFLLHSRPSATKIIYLDFTGHTTTGTFWSNGATIVTPEYDIDNIAGFSNSELQNVQDVWARVVEDFAPFDVDVTTQEPASLEDLRNSGGADDRWGIRVVIGGDNGWLGAAAGGVAYLTSFDWDSDTPCFVFTDNLGNGNPKSTAEATSHEVGHTLGLDHDGRTSPSEGYYRGHGSGPTGWAPIMGVGYSKELVQWSSGQYLSADNQQDDLTIITTTNGFGYRVDDYGSTISTANEPPLKSEIPLSLTGVIEQNTDIDLFRIRTTGSLKATLTPAVISPNLDILAEIWDATGSVIFTSNPLDALNASFDLIVTAGDYFLAIRGGGKGDPLDTGYTNYGSLGQYSMTLTVSSDTTPPVATFATSPTLRNTPLDSIGIDFSRSVSGVSIGDLTLSRNGVPVNLAAATLTGSRLNYTLANLGTATALDGDYTLTLVAAGSGIVDIAGIPLLVNARVSWTLDKTSPAVILATSSPSLTNQSSMVVTVNFSESVSGLSLSDILVTNAVASNLLGSGASYSFTVSPLTDGPVVIEIGPAAAMDAAGNPNTQSNTLSFVSDRSNPATPTFLLVNDSGVNPSDRITNDGRMIVSGLEPLAVWQYSLTGGLLWITGSGTTFVVPDGQYLSGIIRIRQSDAAGNPSFEGFNSASVTVDTVAPVVLFAPIRSPVSSSLKSISFSFTETTYGVVPNDFRLFRDGEAVALVGAKVTGSGMNWAVNNLANFNRIQGGYRIVLTAAGSAITDSAGNFLSLNADREWLVQSIKPSAPRTLTGIPGAGQVLLSWSVPASSGLTIVRDYAVQYANAGGPWISFNDGISTLTTAMVTGLTNGSSYTFRVAAINSLGIGIYSSNSPSITPLSKPSTPTILSTTANDGLVSLTWGVPVSNGGSSITDYILQFSTNSGASWVQSNDSVSINTAATVSSLTNGVTYLFRVAAVNAAGAGDWSSPSSPITPRSLAGSVSELLGVAGNTQATLTWNSPASTGGSPITDYIIQFAPLNQSTWTTFVDGISTVRSATVTGLINGTAYRFRVASKTALGESPFCDPSNSVTPGLFVPEVPTKLKLIASTGSAYLFWTAPQFLGGTSLVDYVVQYSLGGSGSWTTFQDGVSVATSTRVTGLTPGGSYVFRVAAKSSLGTGAWSAISSPIVPKA